MNNVHVITAETLRQFSGSENFYRHSLMQAVVFTEGCAFLAVNGAGWLIDEIAIAQHEKALMREPFQSWKLSVNPESRSAVLHATDGGAAVNARGEPIYRELYRQAIPYTDFPLEEIRLYVCANGEGANGKTIMLASEY
jgi:hypothetical protein